MMYGVWPLRESEFRLDMSRRLATDGESQEALFAIALSAIGDETQHPYLRTLYLHGHDSPLRTPMDPNAPSVEAAQLYAVSMLPFLDPGRPAAAGGPRRDPVSSGDVH